MEPGHTPSTAHGQHIFRNQRNGLPPDACTSCHPRPDNLIVWRLSVPRSGSSLLRVRKEVLDELVDPLQSTVTPFKIGVDLRPQRSHQKDNGSCNLPKIFEKRIEEKFLPTGDVKVQAVIPSTEFHDLSKVHSFQAMPPMIKLDKPGPQQNIVVPRLHEVVQRSKHEEASEEAEERRHYVANDRRAGVFNPPINARVNGACPEQ